MNRGHRSTAALTAAISRAAAEIQTPAICQLLARGRCCSSMVLLPPASVGRTIVWVGARQKARVTIGPDPAVHRIPTLATPEQLPGVDGWATCRPQKTRGVPPAPGRASLQSELQRPHGACRLRGSLRWWQRTPDSHWRVVFSLSDQFAVVRRSVVRRHFETAYVHVATLILEPSGSVAGLPR